MVRKGTVIFNKNKRCKNILRNLQVNSIFNNANAAIVCGYVVKPICGFTTD